MSDRPPLRLIPSPRTAMLGASREAADAATVEAILDGLPPGGRVRIAGEAAWLAVGLDALGIAIVTDDALAADVVAFPLTPLPDDAAAPEKRAVTALQAARTSLDAGGRIVVEAVHPAALRPYEDSPMDLGGEATYVRTLASWVRVLGSAGLVLRSIREPLDAHSGAPVGIVLVAEPECEVSPRS